MNYILKLLDWLFDTDLDQILNQFDRLNQRLDNFQATIDRARYENSRQQSDLRFLLSQLEASSADIEAEADRATRVQQKIRDLMS